MGEYPCDVSVAEALEGLLGNLRVTGVESVPLADASGRVLAEDIVAPGPLPSFDNAAMDGYAVRAAEIAAATADAPVVLRVTGATYAGDRPRGLEPGAAVKIATGAPIPHGADCVVPVEATEVAGETVCIRVAMRKGRHIRTAGEEIAVGSHVAGIGAPLDVAHLMALAALGVPRVTVHQSPRVAVVSIGSELIEPGSAAQPFKVFNASQIALAALIEQEGGRVVERSRVTDDARAISTEFQRLARCVDLIVSTGGVSVGERDMVLPAMLDARANIIFRRVRLKPGKPITAACLDSVPIVALSGNPSPALITAYLFLRPMLRAMTNRTDVHPPTFEAISATPFDRPSPAPRYIWGRCFAVGAESRVELIHHDNSSGIDRAKDANCIVLLDGRDRPVHLGDRVRCFTIRHL